MRIFALARTAVLALSVAAAAGCMSSHEGVRLLYNPEAPSAASATAPRIALVRFADARGRSDLGVRRDGSPLSPASSVADWVCGSLADELSRRGAIVSVVYDRRQAEAGSPDHIIEGTIDEVSLNEKSINTYESVIRIQARIEGGTAPAATRRFVSRQEKSGLPGMRLAEETLSGTLSDVLGNFCGSVMPSIR